MTQEPELVSHDGRPSLYRPLTWLDWTAPGLQENLALDEALLQEVEDEPSRAVVRIWEWPSLAVILGASGRVADDVHLDRCQSDGVVVARRSSGGGTVLLGPGALNIAVVLPMTWAQGSEAVDRAQQFVLDRTAASLSQLGPRVELKGSSDLTCEGRKLAGSAQRRLRHAFLVHTTLLYDFPLTLIGRYLREPKRQPAYRAGRPHSLFVMNYPLDRRALVHAISLAWPPSGNLDQPDAHTIARVDHLVAEKYGQAGWVYRL